MKITIFDPAELKAFEGNARRGDVDAIVRSLEENGQYSPLVVNVGTQTGRANEVLVGNHTLQAILRLKWETVDAVVVDVSEEEAVRIVVADNRTSDVAKYDEAELLAVLSEVEVLDGTGFSDYEVDALRALLEESTPETAPTEPSAPGEALVTVKLVLKSATADRLRDALGDNGAEVLGGWLDAL